MTDNNSPPGSGPTIDHDPQSPPPSARSAQLHTVTEQPGDRIGPFKLLQPLGEGGMGTVWMAEQEQPVQRRVALKFIKAGMDSKSVLARFEADARTASGTARGRSLARPLLRYRPGPLGHGCVGVVVSLPSLLVLPRAWQGNDRNDSQRRWNCCRNSS